MTKGGRAPILLRATLFMVAFVIAAVAAWTIARSLPQGRSRELVVGIIATAAGLGLTATFARFDRMSLRALGFSVTPASAVRVVAGFGVGLLLVAITFVLSVVAFGPVNAVRNPLVHGQAILLAVVAYLGLSAMEEVGFRGYPLRRLRDGMGWWPAQLIVAIGFAIYHIAQGWPPLLAVIGTTAGSILFGAAALRTGGLALPIGIHAGWNVGTWALGQKSAMGLWIIARRPGDDNPITGSAIYLGTMLGAALLISKFWPAGDPADAQRSS